MRAAEKSRLCFDTRASCMLSIRRNTNSRKTSKDSETNCMSFPQIQTENLV